MTYGTVIQGVFYMTLLAWSLIMLHRVLDTSRLRADNARLERAIRALTIENARLRGEQ